MSLVERASDWLTTDAPTTDLTPETAYDLLRSGRRRVVIHTLATASEPVAYADLVDAVAATETDTPPAALDAAARKRVYVSLYQSHIPRLAEANVVHVSNQDGTRVIERGPNLGAVVAVDRLVTDHLESEP